MLVTLCIFIYFIFFFRSGGSESCSLLDRVEALEIAKIQLEKELYEARKHTPRTHQDMSTSVALVDMLVSIVLVKVILFILDNMH